MIQFRYYQKDAIDAFFDHTTVGNVANGLIVIPTGGGKSIIQAEIIRQIIAYPKTRILLLTHDKELISQNYNEFRDLIAAPKPMSLFDPNVSTEESPHIEMDIPGFDPDLDVGIYSAGLKSRDTMNRVLFAGIQSVHKKAWHLGFFDVIIIDEAHRVSIENEGTYRSFLTEMKKINPKIIISGMSATPYRMKGGMICDEEHKDRIFDKIIYECSIAELIDPTHYKNKDNKQYLAKPISKGSAIKADLSQVHIRGGEYIQGELEQAFNIDDLVYRTAVEFLTLTTDRKHILVFATGIKHALNIQAVFKSLGHRAEVVHSKQSIDVNDENIRGFKNGEFRILVNVDKLTTGFNFPKIDCISMWRSTKSTGLYVQIIGRGSRMAEGKENFLVLDYGGNIEEHGPVDKIKIRKNKKGKHELHKVPQKTCPKCYEAISLSALKCDHCGYEYPEPEPNHSDTASDAAIISSYKPPVTYKVVRVRYSEHWKKDSPVPTLRVDYFYNQISGYFSQWVCIEHQGFARRKAEQWLALRTDQEITTVEEAMKLSDTFKQPIEFNVDFNGKFPEIKGFTF
jgi:DNA repair protein RadD